MATAKPPQINTSQNSRQRLWMEVVEFLKSLNFDEYIDVFDEEGFDRMEALYDLNKEDLRDMKIKRGHQKILLLQIEQYKQNKNDKKVRFGGNSSVNDGSATTIIKTNLATVDETKHFTPKSNTPSPAVASPSDDHNFTPSPANVTPPNLKNLNSDSQKSNTYYHNAINPRSFNKLQAPHYHPHQLSGSSGASTIYSDSTRTVLIRSSSVRSTGSESIDDHPYDDHIKHNNVTNVPSYRRMMSSKSMSNRLSHSYSYSNAGTIVYRQSVVDPQDEAVSIYTHRTHGSDVMSASPHYPLSPVMAPLVADMHNDLNSLIESLTNAKCEGNKNYDEYHEALVNVTTNWDRDKCEKDLKYLNAKHNYNNHVILDLLGVLNAQLGRTEEAIKFHTNSIKKSNDKYIEAMHNYAYLLHRIGGDQNDISAVKHYKRALDLNDSFAHCWLHYGNLLEDAGKLKEAASMYRKAISIRPTNAAFHLDLANVLDDLNEFDIASEEYQKCIELQPNDPVYHWNYAISLENQCFFYKAEEAYKRAINLDFNCLDAHLNYAHMLENAKPSPQYKKAMKEYQIILKIPEMMHNTEIMIKLAKLYQHFGEDDNAEELYMSVLQIDPAMEEAYILFAAYLEQQNRIEDANACYQAGIRHVQTPKLQEHYIEFLKQINNKYNNPRNGVTRNGKTSSSSSSTKPTTHKSNRSYVPPSPFVSSYQAPEAFPDYTSSDYYRPAAATKNIPNRGGMKKQTNTNNANPKTTVTANEEGCIVM